MPILSLAIRSLINRRVTALLIILTIALSVLLLLGVERLRTEAQRGFTQTISGTDLIVGARSGSIQLLLYSVFHMGNATNNLSWQSYQELAKNKKIKWTVPISLGDSHRGFRVMGTTQGFFEHYRYGAKQPLAFEQGKTFAGVFDAVLGASVAIELGYQLDDKIIIAHGAGKVSLIKHDDKPFTVAGILEPTGTPVDRSVIVSLQGIEAIHIDWQQGMPVRQLSIDAETASRMDLTPKTITAFLVGLKSRISTFRLQREINEYREEPLLAIVPGVALHELWSLMSIAEKALQVISLMVVLVGLIGMLIALLTGLRERRREMAILRSIGARPIHILLLIAGEGLFLTLCGVGAGVALLYLAMLVLQPMTSELFGFYLEIGLPSIREWFYIALVILIGLVAGLIPGIQAYRYALADGLSTRL
jgi:putative ABC transport system permease protein